MLPNRLSRKPVTQLLSAALLAVAFAAPAAGLEGETCPTWFPDFRCDRSGRWDGFVAPMQMPYLFEDPFITTGLQAVGIYHEYPGHSIFDGGELWVLALQARLALTDRLAFIATKDGYVWHRPDNGPNEDGFFDITLGLKYALFEDKEKNWIVSPSIRFDIPTGQKKVFSGNGSGVGIPAVSAAWGWKDFHVMGDFGARFPFDMNAESTSLFWNLHLSYDLFKHFVPLFEVGGMHWTGHGTALQAPNPPGSFEGVDVVNLGVRSVTGNGIVIVTFGARFPITKNLSFGGSWDMPATDRDDIWKQRATLNVLLEF